MIPFIVPSISEICATRNHYYINANDGQVYRVSRPSLYVHHITTNRLFQFGKLMVDQATNRLYICDRRYNTPSIFVYDLKGTFITTVGNRILGSPVDLCLHRENQQTYLCICDSAKNQIIVFDPQSGHLVKEIDCDWQPAHILSIGDQLLVTNCHNDVDIYDFVDGNRRRTLELTRGKISGMAVVSSNVFVADTEGNIYRYC
jgi:6-bladed beta-propeller